MTCWCPTQQAAGADDLIIAVRAADAPAADAALAQVDALLARKASHTTDFRPRSIETAANMAPDARWLLVSVPGRFAAGVARQGLDLGRHVFLYSDNVSLEDEIALKRTAAEKGLLVMGPDCGTAIVNGTGLGFANAVRRGPIGVIGASGTGLQLVTARIHQLGSGITHALGTGGRDLSEAVGATTALQALDLLGRDPETRVILIVSKPPSPESRRPAGGGRPHHRQAGRRRLYRLPRPRTDPGERLFRPHPRRRRRTGRRAGRHRGCAGSHPPPQPPFAPGQRYLRGIFSGGTLAYEAQLLLQDYVPAVWANAPSIRRTSCPTRSTARSTRLSTSARTSLRSAACTRCSTTTCASSASSRKLPTRKWPCSSWTSCSATAPTPTRRPS